MRKDDDVRLRHMLDAAREALGFVRGRNRVDLNSDRQLVLALVKAIEIIGEAAFRTSENSRAQFPEIRWRTLSACVIASSTPISTSTWMFSGRRCRMTWRPSSLASSRCWTRKGIDGPRKKQALKAFICLWSHDGITSCFVHRRLGDGDEVLKVFEV